MSKETDPETVQKHLICSFNSRNYRDCLQLYKHVIDWGGGISKQNMFWTDFPGERLRKSWQHWRHVPGMLAKKTSKLIVSKMPLTCQTPCTFLPRKDCVGKNKQPGKQPSRFGFDSSQVGLIFPKYFSLFFLCKFTVL